VVAIERNGTSIVNPDPDTPLVAGPNTELIMVGSTDAERQFLAKFFPGQRRRRAARAG
jgi:K+/H+ antiporter YhaU regulatory subunit KhtT